MITNETPITTSADGTQIHNATREIIGEKLFTEDSISRVAVLINTMLKEIRTK
jgi:hypothetical protein